MTETMTLRTPKQLNDLIKSVAKQKGITKNALILQILWQWAENK